jgi:adenine phosphoribosyltransferase
MTTSLNLKDYIRAVPDFPKPGIMFRDITPLLAHPDAFKQSIVQMADQFRGRKIDAILAAEARGFLFAAPLAIELGARLVPVRKPGKLPYKAHTYKYDLEYGSDTLQMHIDALLPGDQVLLVDDLLATGGTMEACIKLAEMCDAHVMGCAFAIELSFLDGRKRLKNREIFSLLSYDSEAP